MGERVPSRVPSRVQQDALSQLDNLIYNIYTIILVESLPCCLVTIHKTYYFISILYINESS